LKAFEPGKVYVLECWAIWCGPCVAAIPHVNDLHKKYHDKGLRVIGMNVWEDDEEKVAEFVKERGEGMSYPVAYTGKGSAFEKEWLLAAGVRGIPHAFVVKDGRLLFAAHPGNLKDEVVEALLAGEEGTRKAVAEINAAIESREKVSGIFSQFRKAAAANDVESMAARITEMERTDPSGRYVQTMKLDLLVARKDWDAAARMIGEAPEGSEKQVLAMMMANKIGMGAITDCPEVFSAAVAKAYAVMLDQPDSPSNPMGQVTLSILQWKAGEKEASLASARKSVEQASKQEGDRQMPGELFERFAKAVEDGRPPAMPEFYGWLREAMGKDKAAKP
jgi:thiol-disulfide isomerase/thioredoxin